MTIKVRHVFNVIFGLLGFAFLLAAPSSHAQPYPNKQVTIIVPYPPGGTSDIPGALAKAANLKLE